MILKYRSILAYLFFGVCTTLINIVVYYLCAYPGDMSTAFSTIIAWLSAVAFAFVTNKAWVFDSKSWEKSILIKEIISFLLCRVATGGMDLVIMMVCVDFLHWNDMVMKIISNVLVIVCNYIASKLVIFKKK